MRRFTYEIRKSNLSKLNPHIHSKTGVVRIGIRLKNADICENQKYPLILLLNSNLSTLLIFEKYLKLLYIVAQELLYSYRQKYWQLSIRNLCEMIGFIFLKSHRTIQLKPANYLIGDLSKTRVQPAQSFANLGIDYVGQFSVKTSSTTVSHKSIITMKLKYQYFKAGGMLKFKWAF